VKPDKIASLLVAFNEVSEEQPFGPGVDVYKVAGKIFAILSAEDKPPALSLKCEPMLALELREEFKAVIPGYHLNKVHWNTVILDGTVPDKEVKNMISHSYEQVLKGLPKALRERISRSGGCYDLKTELPQGSSLDCISLRRRSNSVVAPSLTKQIDDRRDLRH